MAKKKVTELKEDMPDKAQFSREELLLSEQFRDDRDILKILLIPGVAYTAEHACELIETWKKEEEKC